LETILSASTREIVFNMTANDVDLNSLKDRPFDVDGMVPVSNK